MKEIPAIKSTLGNAVAAFDGQTLSVSTGLMQRSWRWTGRGFVTVELTNLTTGRSWCHEPARACDWVLPGQADDNGAAELTGIAATVGDDEGFTAEHIEAIASMDYPEAAQQVQLVVWVYPDSPGIRTLLRTRAMAGYAPGAEAQERRVEHVPVAFGDANRRMFGYYNDTQNRNDTHYDILKEETIDAPLAGPEWCEWASAYCVEDGDEGLAILKESHKCPNQRGVDTGWFAADAEGGLISTGWGLLPREVLPDRYRNAWASWCICYDGGDDRRELAFKQFGRLRFPIDPDRDAYVMANTWGSGSTTPGDTGRDYAGEKVVLNEIDSCADLGIEVQQIDDGWQVEVGATSWQCDAWRPHAERYPDGWARVRARAAERGVGMGLWAAAQPISLEDLKWNFDTGGFGYYKLDFANLNNHEAIEELMAKVRAFVLYTRHAARVNWDVTEISRRYGYFFAREYGLLYLENRKPRIPSPTTYRPHTVLRDVWQLSRYINLTKIQCSVQNLDAVNPERSDARLYNHAYNVAITLMGTPLFFQLTSRYSEAARDAIRPLLAAYKAHRREMFAGYVFPIGSKPDGRSWPGFQCHVPDADAGYLTIFRELHNTAAEQTIALKFLASKTITLTDLMRNETSTVTVGDDGSVDFTIDTPADFRFYRYTCS